MVKSLPSLNTHGEYPELFSPELGLHIKLWWDNNLFNLTSYDHEFSIFFNNEGFEDIPYIQNYYILQYTTICKELNIIIVMHNITIILKIYKLFILRFKLPKNN